MDIARKEQREKERERESMYVLFFFDSKLKPPFMEQIFVKKSE